MQNILSYMYNVLYVFCLNATNIVSQRAERAGPIPFSLRAGPKNRHLRTLVQICEG